MEDFKFKISNFKVQQLDYQWFAKLICTLLFKINSYYNFLVVS
jgi:hypothetical protein